MPKEHKKRGRREEKKRKREEANAAEYAEPVKRYKSEDTREEGVEIVIEGEDVAAYEQQEEYAPFGHDVPRELQFYGMLDEQEQEYFNSGVEPIPRLR